MTLMYGGASYTGTVEVAAAPTAVGRAAAQATLSGVESGLAAEAPEPGGGSPVRAEVDRVEIAGVDPDAVATVVVSLLTRAGTQRYAGAALVAGDARQAVIRATLAAVNRRVERYLD